MQVMDWQRGSPSQPGRSILDQMRSRLPVGGRARHPASPHFLQNPNTHNDLIRQMHSAAGVL